jgi:hypothetical protein
MWRENRLGSGIYVGKFGELLAYRHTAWDGDQFRDE